MKVINAFLIVVLMFSKSSYSQQGSKHKLIGSIWVCKTNGCIDSLIFKSSKLVKQYRCAQDNSFNNTYTVVGDTLIITEEADAIEDHFKITYYRYKYMISSNELKLFITGKFINHKWKYSRYPLNYIFKRV